MRSNVRELAGRSARAEVEEEEEGAGLEEEEEAGEEGHGGGRRVGHVLILHPRRRPFIRA